MSAARGERGSNRAHVRPSVALAVVREHPRHLVLAALVAGLLVDRAGAAAVLVAAVGFAVLAQRPWPAALAAAAVLAGATLADARLAALDAGVLAHMHGQSIETRAIVLEPVRDRVRGPSAARVRLLDGPGAGEQAVLRSRMPGHARAAEWGWGTSWRSPGGWRRWGSRTRISGRGTRTRRSMRGA